MHSEIIFNKLENSTIATQLHKPGIHLAAPGSGNTSAGAEAAAAPAGTGGLGARACPRAPHAVFLLQPEGAATAAPTLRAEKSPAALPSTAAPHALTRAVPPLLEAAILLYGHAVFH